MMNKKILLGVSMILAGTGSASAGSMYLDLAAISGGAGYDVTIPMVRTADANTTTGVFNEFGFNQLLATSIYDFSDGSIFGTFYDSNVSSELSAAGIPASGTAMDGSTSISLVMPNCPAGQCDINSLNPLVPPLGSDNEGFLTTWDLQVVYHFDGVLTAGGPTYTGGYFEVYFNSILDDVWSGGSAGVGNRIGIAGPQDLVIKGDLTGSTIQAANLDLFFDITYAKTGFLYIKNDATGLYRDAALGGATLQLDTNVNPPIPEAKQLLLVGTNAIRQTTLDGSVTGHIPEPATIAMMGLGLLGLGAASRRRKQ